MNQPIETTECTSIRVEDDRTGVCVETLKRAFADNLFYVQGKFPAIATQNDFYMALAYTVRDRLIRRWIGTYEAKIKQTAKVVAYLSAEFLMGPQWAITWSVWGFMTKLSRPLKNQVWS
jgi:glycogen phosphorylase